MPRLMPVTPMPRESEGKNHNEYMNTLSNLQPFLTDSKGYAKVGVSNQGSCGTTTVQSEGGPPRAHPEEIHFR